MSSALTTSFSVRQPPNEPFVLSCPPAAPRLPCGCRRRLKDFRPLRPGLDPPEIVVLLQCPERAFHHSRPHSDEFHHYVVQQLVVRQWPCRIYYHVAEYQVVDVAVQLFRQFRTGQSRVHLQEYQGNFLFRSEERPASQLRPHAFPHQTEVLCHLAER